MKIRKVIEINAEIYTEGTNNDLCSVFCRYNSYIDNKCLLFNENLKDNNERVVNRKGFIRCAKCRKIFGNVWRCEDE
jgi:hypothetical protein